MSYRTKDGWDIAPPLTADVMPRNQRSAPVVFSNIMFGLPSKIPSAMFAVVCCPVEKHTGFIWDIIYKLRDLYLNHKLNCFITWTAGSLAQSQAKNIITREWRKYKQVNGIVCPFMKLETLLGIHIRGPKVVA